jgi:hypothetical protein
MVNEVETAAEQPLFGGIAEGRVFKVGDTVRRPAGPWTPTLHALLRHLRQRGFPCPEPLGLDDAGREVLGFLPGRASNWPWPPILLEPDGARRIGAMLARYHAAAADFAPPSPAIWAHGPQELGAGEVALHGDFGPHNLVWNGDELTGVIDFELARPGAPMEDAGFAVIRAAQLRPDEMTRGPGFESPPERLPRLEAFAAGFGASRSDLVGAALLAQRAEIERIERFGLAGLEPWVTFRSKGLADVARAELAWIESNATRLA